MPPFATVDMICISLDGPDFLGDHMPPNSKVFFLCVVNNCGENEKILARSLEIQKENWG